MITQVDVFQYDGTQYDYVDGTSFSAPMVAGVLALMMSQQPARPHNEVRQLLLDNVDVLPTLTGKVTTGGRLNAQKALQALPEPSAVVQLLAGCLAVTGLYRVRGRSHP